ncbi:hypothetical protein Poly41_04530 [Novipirellula artificiosorum]|uniref:Uncharacterized protein n=2 Tax=Novipirellula artificiosorum TaxID=2528016 RepID=A0A5C6E2F0_9BACT|nr:hypothetical protein Poly41_04530 [Novipirellula artificiosorum]
MALVVVRGALFGELADQVASEAIMALLVFTAIGWIAGWIADYLVRDAVEVSFRRRVDWYRQGVAESVRLENKPSEES